MQDSQIDTPITTHQPKSQIKIIKRSGKKVPLNVDKIHFVVEQACDGITGVSASQIEMNSDLQFVWTKKHFINQSRPKRGLA